MGIPGGIRRRDSRVRGTHWTARACRDARPRGRYCGGTWNPRRRRPDPSRRNGRDARRYDRISGWTPDKSNPGSLSRAVGRPPFLAPRARRRSARTTRGKGDHTLALRASNASAYPVYRWRVAHALSRLRSLRRARRVDLGRLLRVARVLSRRELDGCRAMDGSRHRSPRRLRRAPRRACVVSSINTRRSAVASGCQGSARPGAVSQGSGR